MNFRELIHQLRYSEDEVARFNAAEQLIHDKNPEVVLALIGALGDEDESVQGAAMSSLKTGTFDSVPFLRNALRHEIESIRWGVAELLEFFPDEKTELVLGSALDDTSPNVRGAAARSLRKMMVTDLTCEKLLSLLNDSDTFPRYEALLTLETVRPSLVDEVKIIQRDLYSGHQIERLAAIHFIRRYNKTNWLSDVKNLLQDFDPRVKEAALWTINHLTATNHE